ncbi:DNA repair protein RadC [Akkermansiaceae bacterium]|nr:DNA repair protein RadC [Akkermansiaceae bacterium]
MNQRIHDIPNELRPREKSLKHGLGSLSDAELLALFIGNGFRGENAINIGQNLLNANQSLAGIAKLSPKQLTKEKGIGIAKATLISAACEMGKRIAKQEITKVALNSPEVIYQMMHPLFTKQTVESVYVLCLDTKLMCIQQTEVTCGTVNQSICHPRDVLHEVITNQAHGFILVHNHPSGDPTPSNADHQITKSVSEAASIMQVKFHDHIIIGSPREGKSPFYSFNQEGKM